MPNKLRQVLVIALYSHKDGHYRNVFVNTALKPRQLHVIVKDMLVSTIRRGRYAVDIFGTKFTVDDLLRPEAIDDWRNCKSLAAYKERLFQRDTYDFDLNVYTLKHFLNANTQMFEDYAGNDKAKLQEAINNKIVQTPDIIQAIEEGGQPDTAAVGEIAQALVNQLEETEEETEPILAE